MLYRVFAVRDLKAESFNRPFFLPSIGMAERSFTDEVNRPADDNVMNRYPADFSLYHLGNWDDETARFDQFDVPTLVAHAAEVIKSA